MTKHDNPAQADLRGWLTTELNATNAKLREVETVVKNAQAALEQAKAQLKEQAERKEFLEKQVADNTPKEAHAHKPAAHGHAHAKTA